MQTGPVDFDLFMAVTGGMVMVGLSVAGYLSRRTEAGMRDLRSALTDHQRQTAAAELRNSEFREETLRELGGIGATLARLESRLPPLPQPQTGD